MSAPTVNAASEKISDESGQTLYLSWSGTQLVMTDKDGNPAADFFVHKGKDLKFSKGDGTFTMSSFQKLGDNNVLWDCDGSDVPYPFTVKSSGKGQWNKDTRTFTSSDDGVVETTTASGEGSAGHYVWIIADTQTGKTHDPSMEIES